jgi:2-haloacid dehalogenase
MNERLREVTVLTFDVGGTVFDWHTAVTHAVNDLASSRGVQVDASAFAVAWRELFFTTLAKVRNGTLRRMNADGIHRLTLDEVAQSYLQLALSDEDKDELTDVWHQLPAWPDANPAIQRLREAYTDGLDLLGVEPRQAMMVAAHPWDLNAAHQAGLATAYIPRPLERGAATSYEPSLPDADLNAKDFTDLADQLLA